MQGWPKCLVLVAVLVLGFATETDSGGIDDAFDAPGDSSAVASVQAPTVPADDMGRAESVISHSERPEEARG